MVLLWPSSAWAAPAAVTSSVSWSPPGVQQVAHDQPDREREGRHQQEVADRQQADLAHPAPRSRPNRPEHDRAEDDRWIIIVISPTNPSPRGLSRTAKSGKDSPTATPSATARTTAA